MDFDNRKVYSDSSITDGLVFFDVHALRHHILPNSDEIMIKIVGQAGMWFSVDGRSLLPCAIEVVPCSSCSYW